MLSEMSGSASAEDPRDRSFFVRLASAAAMGVVALALWLSGGSVSLAASANQTQGLSLDVPAAISWGSVGTCTQSMPAYDFGTVSGGGSATSSVFTGCVTSNATWQVAASMTTEPSNGSETVPGSAFVGQIVTAPATSTTNCNAVNTTCTLDSSQTLFSGAPTTLNLGVTNLFTYKYQLDVPAGQASGDYNGGVVTFVASN